MQIVRPAEGVPAMKDGRATVGYLGPHPALDEQWQGPVEGPQVFEVTMPPGNEIRPHFHPVSQFQVVVGGAGTIGSDAVAPTAVHYAAAHTVYGPLTAGADGLRYLVFRAACDRGAFFMPESRARREPVVGRHFVIREPGADQARSVDEPDGLSARFETLPAGATSELSSTAGQPTFAYVVRGAARLAPTDPAGLPADLPAESLCYWTSGEPRPAITATGAGCTLLVMTFAALSLDPVA